MLVINLVVIAVILVVVLALILAVLEIFAISSTLKKLLKTVERADARRREEFESMTAG